MANMGNAHATDLTQKTLETLEPPPVSELHPWCSFPCLRDESEGNTHASLGACALRAPRPCDAVRPPGLVWAQDWYSKNAKRASSARAPRCASTLCTSSHLHLWEANAPPTQAVTTHPTRPSGLFYMHLYGHI